jgi:ATP-dependent RNA helicase TDRD9
VKIDPDSVNSVAIDDEPHYHHDRLMIAGFVGLNPVGSTMVARDTTILPSIAGLPSLVSLLFCPVAELR